jgi:hypothetical protein
MNSIIISRLSFHYLLSTGYFDYAAAFLNRYMGLSKKESHFLFPEIERLCWETTLEDERVLTKPHRLLDQVMKKVGVEYLQNCHLYGGFLAG